MRAMRGNQGKIMDLALVLITHNFTQHICILSSFFSPFGKKPAGGSSSVMPYGGGLAGVTAASAAPAAPAAAAPAPVAAAPAAPAYSSTPAAPAQPAKSYR